MSDVAGLLAVPVLGILWGAGVAVSSGDLSAALLGVALVVACSILGTVRWVRWSLSVTLAEAIGADEDDVR